MSERYEGNPRWQAGILGRLIDAHGELRIILHPGDHITDVAAVMVRVAAERCQTVYATFNGVALFARAGATVAEIEAAYHAFVGLAAERDAARAQLDGERARSSALVSQVTWLRELLGRASQHVRKAAENTIFTTTERGAYALLFEIDAALTPPAPQEAANATE